MVLAATAIPVELRPLGQATWTFSIDADDVLENVAGYVAVGIVLGGLGLLRTIIAAALISTFAEAGQLVMLHRDPSVVDIASNVTGAILGAVVSMRWKIRSPGFRVDKWKALVALTLSFAVVLGVWVGSGAALSSRGATAPGILEAHWKLDESRGRVALDSSGHRLHGKFRKEPKRGISAMGGVVEFDGARDYIDFGHRSAFRLVGSMTISAWIKPTAFPIDDAAIVSSTFRLGQANGLGYQLDTTVDRGPRTIGFKLANACSELMARYGKTPLVVDTWYHVAGVYNAEARTLDVYLNGELDNGFVLGRVTGTQRSSREAVYVGRRSDLTGYEFAGSIANVRLYSRALTKAEVSAATHGEVNNSPVVEARTRDVELGRVQERPGDLDAQCVWLSDPEDAKIPGAAAALGMLVAVACAGLWPSSGKLGCLLASFAAGLLLLPAMASTFHSPSRWMMPLVSLAGGVSVVVSLRGQDDLEP
jgi:Concanavalin A-like lectin/glucanases superfamily